MAFVCQRKLVLDKTKHLQPKLFPEERLLAETTHAHSRCSLHCNKQLTLSLLGFLKEFLIVGAIWRLKFYTNLKKDSKPKMESLEPSATSTSLDWIPDLTLPGMRCTPSSVLTTCSILFLNRNYLNHHYLNSWLQGQLGTIWKYWKGPHTTNVHRTLYVLWNI